MPIQQLNEPTNVIMPLADTQRELDGTANVLMHLWNQRQTVQLVAHHLAKQTFKQVFLVGSGDSLAVAQLACHDMESMLSIPCRAWQSYEFMQQAESLLDSSCLVIAISASGRPSPVLEALKLAIDSDATVVGITNQPNNPFSQLPDYCLLTYAEKRGMPTQSTTTTLFLLLLLSCELAYYQKAINHDHYQLVLHSLNSVAKQLPDVQRTLMQQEQQHDRSRFFQQSITFLSTGSTNAIATLGSNLMSCGPQLNANAFLLEEYHHSLRLNQVRNGQIVFLFSPFIDAQNLIAETVQTLQQTNVDVIILSPHSYFSSRPAHFKHAADQLSTLEISAINRQTNFYHLIFLQRLSLQLAADYVAAGGVRVSHA